MILVECLTLFWSPAKEASVPNLVPREKLESANQVSLLAAYGTAPIAAILFTFLSLFTSAFNATFSTNVTAVNLALYANALSFFFAAIVIFNLREIPKGAAAKHAAETGLLKSLHEGWKTVSGSKIIRGLIVGMVGAFVAAGAVIGLARTFVGDLGGGDAAYGVLFGAVFTGLAAGIAFGPKIFAQFSVFVVIILGAFSGICWVTGFTMLGLEVTDDVRGRTFAFVQSLIRVVLVAVLAISPLIAAAVGQHTFTFQNTELSYNGAAVTILIAGLIASLIGFVSYKQMKDRPNVSLWSDISNALKGELGSMTGAPAKGIFIAFEGGEGIGKSTQSQLLKQWLEQEGESVVLSREPGGTDLGVEIRKILLSHSTGEISPRAEALLYAADRAHHVYSVIRPALARGEVVISDRYFDSSIAYQGAGRVLQPGEVARISRWATESLFPTLTIIIDLAPEIGLGRLMSKDRLESQPIDFHERVRQEFLQIAALDPERYLIVSGNQSIQATHAEIVARVSEIAGLKRNAREDKGNLLLRPIRAAGKAVKHSGASASKAVKKSSQSAKAAASKTKRAAKK
jgi:dTMP kinase